MSATIGDGMTALALAGGIVGHFYMKHQSRQKRIEIIHQERMATMEKGIPLPEFPLEPARGIARLIRMSLQSWEWFCPVSRLEP